jgi:hypothetical protein
MELSHTYCYHIHIGHISHDGHRYQHCVPKRILGSYLLDIEKSMLADIHFRTRKNGVNASHTFAVNMNSLIMTLVLIKVLSVNAFEAKFENVVIIVLRLLSMHYTADDHLNFKMTVC